MSFTLDACLNLRRPSEPSEPLALNMNRRITLAPNVRGLALNASEMHKIARSVQIIRLSAYLILYVH